MAGMQPGRRNKEKLFSVFVCNLPLNIRKVDLYELFKGCGSIQTVFISTPTEDCTYTYGFVRFSEVSSAARAVRELDGWPVMGHNLRVEITNSTLQDVHEQEGIEMSRKGQHKINPEDQNNLQLILETIEKMNSQLDPGEQIDGQRILEAAAKEPYTMVPLFKPKEVPINMDFTELDRLMEEELKADIWNKPTEDDEIIS